VGLLSTLGQPVRRREDARLLAGQGVFLDDIRIPGTLHMAFVRSPHAHAKVAAIRPPGGRAARAVGDDSPTRVWMAADIAGRVFPQQIVPPPGLEVAPVPHPVLAEDEVRYVGQPVAAVVAPTRAQAEDLAQQVEVDYQPLPAVTDPRAGETLVRWEKQAGHVARAFAEAAYVVRTDTALPRLTAAPPEPRGVLAHPTGDRLTVYASSQSAHRSRQELARCLAREEDSLRVIVPDVGGGPKNTLPVEAPLVAYAARQLQQPVKWAEDRRENELAAPQASGLQGALELAFDAGGRLLALRGRILADLGAYLLPSTAFPPHAAAMLLSGAYDVRNVEVFVTGARTHQVPTAPALGGGRAEASHLLETAMDEAARALGIDRVDLRRRNLVTAFPYRTALGWTYDSGDFETCLDRALALLPDLPAPEGTLVGTGVALWVERSGGLFEYADVTREGASIVVRTGSVPSGQGYETLFAQIAADKLGIDPSWVKVVHGDTDEVPEGLGSFSSRSTAMGGSAVAEAAQDMIDNGTNKGRARFASDQVFSSGAHAARVEVAKATGHVTVTHLVAVDDAGRIINPLLAHGQVIGTSALGVSSCFDEPITAAEIPAFATDFVESPSPNNPLGAKGIGESGVIGAPPAIANALADAIGRRLDPPFTAARVWEALR